MNITYVEGDITDLQRGPGTPVAVAHVCNTEGAWGRGVVVPVGRRWPKAKAAYLELAGSDGLPLGLTQVVDIDAETWVVNMVAQEGLRSRRNPSPIRYEALERCLGDLGDAAYQAGAEVHMPRIGCGLGGGDWAKVEELIRTQVCGQGVPVVVYDLPAR